MSKYIRNWEDWDEIEDETSLEQTRNKRKNKLHKESKVSNVNKKHENNQIKYDYEIIDKGTVAPKFDKTLDDIIRNISLKSTLNT